MQMHVFEVWGVGFKLSLIQLVLIILFRSLALLSFAAFVSQISSQGIWMGDVIFVEALK
jgi:hypothetical protein